ncbi:MAG TPA: nitroreductase [Allosphingosinicella sp.]|nr:nitroreductase [Allosphingosinicella sp.]
MFNDLSTPLSLLRTRRSGRPRDLIEPGPDAEQLREILAIAARTPDHGKLAPWRFIHVGKAQRTAFCAMLEASYRAGRAEEPGRLEVDAVQRFAHQAPELVIVLSSAIAEAKIPVWEQELSCGAACMNLLLAVHALGFAGGWVTGWATYSQDVHAALGAREGERIAGFFFLGTLGAPQEERPRPPLDAVISAWSPPPTPGAA